MLCQLATLTRQGSAAHFCDGSRNRSTPPCFLFTGFQWESFLLGNNLLKTERTDLLLLDYFKTQIYKVRFYARYLPTQTCFGVL